MSLKSGINSFIRDCGANIAMIWALSLLPIIGLIGIAVDTQMTFGEKDRVQNAADSAVLAGARMLQSTNSEEKSTEHAEAYFNSLLGAKPGLTCEPLKVTFPGEDDVQAEVKCKKPTTLSSIMGRGEIEFNVASTATYGVGKLDVSFVFDISGSMNSYGRLDDLKEAAKDAVTTLLPAPGSSSEGDVRISMVGYNSMIDAGEYFEDVTGMKKNRTYVATYNEPVEECTSYCRFTWGPYCLSWGSRCEWVDKEQTSTKKIQSTCVYERDGSDAFGEAQPTQKSTPQLVDTLLSGQKRASTDANNADGFLSTAYATFNEAHKSWSVHGTSCLDVEPFELSHNHTQIDQYINRLYASGGTAGHQGVAWGWYLISPEWSDVFDNHAEPLSYEEPDTVKAMIIMTDGEFNSQEYGGQGSSKDQAKALCDKIKDAGVVVYTIAFQAPDEGEEVLAYCATKDEFALTAANGQELKDQYQYIATSISDLRIKS